MSNKAVRVSLAIVITLSLDNVVEPAKKLLDNQNSHATYIGWNIETICRFKAATDLIESLF